MTSDRQNSDADFQQQQQQQVQQQEVDDEWEAAKAAPTRDAQSGYTQPQQQQAQ